MKFFYKLIYEIICFVYSRLLTVLENSFLKINVRSISTLDRDGFLKITKNTKLNVSQQRFDFILNENEFSFFSNKYQKKFILSQDNLNSIVKLIFDRDFNTASIIRCALAVEL